ncbi:bifunctional riboflavin kinase/FAD synthetase [Crocinitomix catalasitica]|uniref:bifunctional riboflavin kinase/FAD synthetase n=1 Tax=Crocinitomix catalasitica TaxID=184607 RepID=UPI00048484FB|nr:bifunctional riboflavin kinase/FAD synthetase [Crocinitomix catalasitica]
MKVYYSVEELPVIKNAVLTLGTYDGVHLGHQKIIEFLVKSAKEMNGETVLFTLHPHPRVVLYPDDHGMQLIQPIEERIKKLAASGIDHLILFPFSKEFSRLTATEFVRDILVNKIGIKMMTIGYNHHFGRNRQGNLSLLKELGDVYDFKVQEIPAFKKLDHNVSSTKIRAAITDGDITTANTYLGSPFEFIGTVVTGDKIGTGIGYPTANIEPNSDLQLIPKKGVYAVQVKFGDHVFNGMMNIGTRPTINELGEDRIEIHIFNFDQDIYGETLNVKVFDRVRDEERFSSLDDLKAQLKKDEENCIDIFNNLALLK